jgi:asparagine synthetase A
MFLLRCAHIGETQSSLWSDEMIDTCKQNNIFLK